MLGWELLKGVSFHTPTQPQSKRALDYTYLFCTTQNQCFSSSVFCSNSEDTVHGAYQCPWWRRWRTLKRSASSRRSLPRRVGWIGRARVFRVISLDAAGTKNGHGRKEVKKRCSCGSEGGGPEEKVGHSLSIPSHSTQPTWLGVQNSSPLLWLCFSIHARTVTMYILAI
jgi:hypothetical protein